MKKFLLVIPVLLFFFGCKIDDGKEDLKQALREFEPTTQIFEINKDSIVEIRGAKGTILKIDPSVLQHLDGSSVTSEIEVRLMELTTTEDLLRANAQTVSNGKWLMSGGAYQIQIYADNKELKIADEKSIEVNFPKITSKKMQLFDGNRDVKGNMNWELSNQVLIGKKYPVLIRKDSSFMRYNRPFAIDMSVDSVIYNSLKEMFTIDEIVERYPELDSIIVKNDTILGIRFKRIIPEIVPGDSINDVEILYDVETGKFLNAGSTYDLMNDVYAAITINKLGWKNVDWFYPEIIERVRFEIVADVDMDYAQIYAADTENNALVNLFEDEKGLVSFNAPQGIRLTIIAFGIKDEQTYGYKKSVLMEKDTKHQIKYRKVDGKKMEDYFKLD